jgi:hypothetical protein
MSQTHAPAWPYYGPMFRATSVRLMLLSAVLVPQVAAQSAPPPVPALSARPFGVSDPWSSKRISTPPRGHTGFVRLAIWSTAALSADMATTEIALATTRGAEFNPVFGRRPSPERLWGTAVPVQAIFLYACRGDSLEHPRGRFWRVAMKLSVGVHTAAAASNLLLISQQSR